MSDNLEHIDNYFKENIDKIDVQYNAAHWDKLQKSLLIATAATTTVIATSKWQAILKFLKLYKLIFIGIPSIAVVATSIVYFSKEEPNNQLFTPILKDSTSSNVLTPTLPDTQAPKKINNSFFIKPFSSYQIDSPIYASPYQIDTTKKTLLLRKDSVVSTKQDTTSQKKKSVNVFW